MSERRRGTKAVAVLLATVAFVAGACTNGDSTESGTGSDGGAADGSADAAGESTGVTDDTITIGWPTIDQAALVEAGLAVDFGDVTEIAQAMVDDWNADGGIAGREVVLVERSFGTDIANLLPDMQRVCLELTEDEQVFATAAFAWFGDAVTCVAGDHDTPLIVETSLSQTVLDTGNDNIFLANFVWEEALRGAVRAAEETGELAEFGTIGVFAPLEPGMREAIDDGLAPALEEAGAEIAEDGTIPFSAQPDNAAVAAVVSRFKASGVDAVFPLGNFLLNGAFLTEAERQGYRPTYVMADMSEGTDDLIVGFAPPEQLEGAVGGSWKGKSPDPVPTEAGQACLEDYAPEAETVTQQVGAAQTCELMDLVRQGLEGSGEQPTREGFIEALEGIGTVNTSGGGSGSYGPDDHALPDQVRLVRFDLDGCECWVAEGDWVDLDG